MIYFDNAATTFPKPDCIKKAAILAISKYGGNPGRSGHKYSIKAAEKVYEVRQLAADFFGANPENVVFTLNCTHSLNLAIKGILKKGDHVIISCLEHNSVARPVHALLKNGITYSVADVSDNDIVTLKNFENLITPQTKAIVCTIASNVTGQILPFKGISKLCQKYHICFIADGAQACGVIPVKLSDGINILCCPGHKGLYGTTGTGLLITDGQFPINAVFEGGTGATSDELEQTPFLPEKLECGTVNTVGIVCLGKGIEFINRLSISYIHRYEEKLCNYFIREIKKIEGFKIYRNYNANYAPIVSFSYEKLPSPELSQLLSDYGFALRGGLHCATLTHNFLGTISCGTVRFSPSVFNTQHEVYELVRILKKITSNC